jgi:hypothetical protein
MMVVIVKVVVEVHDRVVEAGLHTVLSFKASHRKQDWESSSSNAQVQTFIASLALELAPMS